MFWTKGFYTKIFVLRRRIIIICSNEKNILLVRIDKVMKKKICKRILGQNVVVSGLYLNGFIFQQGNDRKHS